jgi:hypothetical protein
MRNVLTLTTTTAAALIAFSGIASAADMLTGYQESDGYVTQSTCGSLSPSLAVGSPTDSWARYPGASKTGFTLASPGTTSSTSAGGANTNVCVATAAVPSTGLNGASLTFNCYTDTTSGPGSSPTAQLKSTFKMGASHSAQVKQVTTTSSLVINGVTACSFTADSTWTAE